MKLTNDERVLYVFAFLSMLFRNNKGQQRQYEVMRTSLKLRNSKKGRELRINSSETKLDNKQNIDNKRNFRQPENLHPISLVAKIKNRTRRPDRA